MDRYEAFNVLFLPFSLKVCSPSIKMQLGHNLFLVLIASQGQEGSVGEQGGSVGLRLSLLWDFFFLRG